MSLVLANIYWFYCYKAINGYKILDMLRNKTIYISVDFEEWYHIPYMSKYREDYKDFSYCDKLVPFFETLKENKIPSTVFVVGEIAEKYKDVLLKIKELGNVIGAHSYKHDCYKAMTNEQFAEDVKKAKTAIENAIGSPIAGFRAPMFAASFEKLNLLSSLGFTFDSSSINSKGNPFYCQINSRLWDVSTSGLKEYEIPTHHHSPLGGGGFFRIYPLWLYKLKVKKYLKKHDTFVFFLHPYEIVKDEFPGFDKWIFTYGYKRYHYGRKGFMKKFWKFINYLKKQGVKFDVMK